MDKGVVMFVEGDTELEFYKKVINQLHAYPPNGKFKTNQLVTRNLKGITNYKERLIRVFKKEIIVKYPDAEFTVVLCYDTDVFEYSYNPPVNWPSVKKDLKKSGAAKIIDIKAKKSIEDWFLLDRQGVLNYLKLPHTTNIPSGDGLKTIQNLFKKAGKVYVKGSSVKGFMDCLNIQVIMGLVCEELRGLCSTLGIECAKNKPNCQINLTKLK